MCYGSVHCHCAVSNNSSMCICVQFLITCNIPFSAMIMVAIAVDRYLSICQPLFSALTPLRAWLVTVVLAVFAAAIGVCVALMYSVRHYAPLPDDRKQFSSNQSTVSTTIAGCLQTSPDHDEVTTAGCTTTSPQSAVVEVDRGMCYPAEETFSTDFIWYFQKAYNSLYLACFIAVVVLYILIYRSVLTRRSRRQRQKNRSVSLITTYSQRPRPSTRPKANSVISFAEETNAAELQELALGCQDTITALASTTAEAVALQAVRDRKRNRVANLKTAAMLFVVTVVFVVTFLPAFLMTVQFIPYNMIIFYMYFANNVANPIIYSFMNHNFRGQLKRMICRRHGHRAN